jgi:hypothetical protein
VKYVDIDERAGTVNWDAYFDYIRSIRGRLSPTLYAYAENWEHYSLDGVDSLHDAWLCALQWSTRDHSVVIEFIGARQDRRHLFRYKEAKSYVVTLDVHYVHGDRDVLAHEFRIEGKVVEHEIAFSGGKSILVRATDIEPIIEIVQ